MSDYINRADAMRRISEQYHKWGDDYDALQILGDLEDMPSAELTLQTPQTYGKSINPSNGEVVADYISRADAIEAVQNEKNTRNESRCNTLF